MEPASGTADLKQPIPSNMIILILNIVQCNITQYYILLHLTYNNIIQPALSRLSRLTQSQTLKHRALWSPEWMNNLYYVYNNMANPNDYIILQLIYNHIIQ